MEKKLEVKNLVISFRTQAGKVQAVRDISFDLYKGETLAIVGESGSGKSATSKEIIGISANNAIIEQGEILYDGQDLVRIPEEEMHKLRGDKIAMIFQDPLSSLDPIMRIGQQITEAMLLKNKVNRKQGRIAFNEKLAVLCEKMICAMQEEYAEKGAQQNEIALQEQKIKEYIKTFDAFNIKAIALENNYNIARTAAEELIAIIEDFVFLVEKNQKVDVKATLKLMLRKLKVITDKYFVGKYFETLKLHATDLSALQSSKETDMSMVLDTVKAIKDNLQEMLAQTPYNFFRIGYYLYKNPTEDLSTIPAEEANEKALIFLEDNFMREFLALTKSAIVYSRSNALLYKEDAICALEKAMEFFSNGTFTKAEVGATWKAVNASVVKAIDRLDTVKDNVAYTFGGALQREIDRYFFYLKNNPKEEKRFAMQTAKREALIAKGKKVDWKVVPKFIVLPEEQIQNILSVLRRVKTKFEADLKNADKFDVEKSCIELVDYLKAKASQVVYKLTPRVAKEKAIKLMEEVGIPEPRIRYTQYPFEFSGGMRQRIVIAIALSANPDILICDEPTTALDVTIQAQILELINKLKKERELSIIFITHDLGVVANMADRIAVMYAGKIVEYGTAEDIFYDPRHPYTWALLSSMPDLNTNEKLDAIPGTPPNMIYPPVGDAFAERNKYAMEIDFELEPPMFEVSPTHYAATWLLHPNAEKVEIPKIITERIKRMKAEGDKDGK